MIRVYVQDARHGVIYAAQIKNDKIERLCGPIPAGIRSRERLDAWDFKGLPIPEVEDELRERLQRWEEVGVWADYDQEKEGAWQEPSSSAQAKCIGCEQVKVCTRRPTGLVTHPYAWFCDECWSYVTETHA